MTLWQAHEPDLIELGERAERAGRFSFLYDPWVDPERHNPRRCICYLLPIFFNHVEDSPCQCVGCAKVRRFFARRLSA